MIEERYSWFDPAKDRHEVDQFGYIDLVEVFAHGSIASDVNVRDLSFNEIGDPSSILGSPKDVFDAHRMAAEINTRAAGVADSAQPSAAPAAEINTRAAGVADSAQPSAAPPVQSGETK